MPAWADNDTTPDAAKLIARVRQGATLQENKDVSGRIRKRSVKIPFTMSLRGPLIAFQYSLDGKATGFDLKFKEKGLDILLRNNGKSSVLPVSKYADLIAGTDVAYEDLSMRYLYWPKPKIVQDEAASTVKGRECWIVQIPNPKPGVGQYAWIRVWIDKENGAMWQMDGIDQRGELSKRFLMDSIMKLKDGSWFFKRMKVEVRDPKNPRKTISVSYIEMDDPE